jgi:hypothetical protein
MSSNVPNWDAIINKVVNTKEGDLIGNVEATDENAVLVSTEGARTHYRIPKPFMMNFVINYQIRADDLPEPVISSIPVIFKNIDS